MNQTTTTAPQQQESKLVGIRYRPEVKKWKARINVKGTAYSKTFSDVNDAIAWRKNLQEQKESDHFYTLGELVPKWIESLGSDPKISPCTVRKYATSAKCHFAPYFHAMSLKDITGEKITEFAIKLKETKNNGKYLSIDYIDDIMTAFTSFLEYCCIRNHIILNPAKSEFYKQNFKRLKRGIKKFGDDLSERARLPEELELLLSAAYKEGFEFGVSVEFMLSTGIRLGEASALSWNDFIARRDGTYTCLINKTRIPRTRQIRHQAKCGSNGIVPVSNYMMQKLLQLKAACPFDQVFYLISKNQDGFSKKLALVSERIGIRRTTAHCLRHSFITYLAMKELPLQSIQKASRHKSGNMTQAYINYAQVSLGNIPGIMEDLTSEAKAIPNQILG